MQLTTVTLLAVLTALSSFHTAKAAAAAAPAIYGSPGIVSMKGFSSENGAAVCKGKPKAGPTLRLPKEYMGGTASCGKTVTVYYTPAPPQGMAEPPELAAMQATVWGLCPSCKSFEAEASGDLWNSITDNEDLTAFWGPAVVWGTQN